jgi:hypothetical protein
MKNRILKMTAENVTLHEAINNFHQQADDNILSVGYGFKTIGGKITNEKSIVFSVKNKISLDQLEPDKIIQDYVSINGEAIKTDVVEISDIRVLACDPNFTSWQNTPPSNRNKIRPIKGGLSAINYTDLPNYHCTMGFLALDNTDNKIVGVSNVHCASSNPFSIPAMGAYVANEIRQPSNGSKDDIIGFLKRINYLKQGSNNLADVAIYSLIDSVVGLNSQHEQEGLSASSFASFASYNEIQSLITSDPDLYSSGRTTGAKGQGSTKLKINQIGVSVKVGGYGGSSGPTSFINCMSFIAVPSGQTRPYSEACKYPIFGGDSGSALIADINGSKKIIGLVFAGASNQAGECVMGYACNIIDVAEAICISSASALPP